MFQNDLQELRKCFPLKHGIHLTALSPKECWQDMANKYEKIPEECFLPVIEYGCDFRSKYKVWPAIFHA